jgi:hypothetical protein
MEFGTAAVNSTTGWSDYKTTSVAPAGAAKVGIDVQIGNSAAGTVQYIDRVGLFRGDVETFEWVAPVVPGPAGVSSGLSAWYRADSIAQADGTAVTTWPDLGKRFSGSAPGPTNQPTYKTNIVNGQPVVRFDGTSDEIWSNAPSGDPEQTVFAVVRPTDRAATRTIRGTDPNAGLQVRLEASTGIPQLIKQADSDVAYGTTAVPAAAFSILTVVFSESSGTYAFYLNGTDAGSGVHESILPTTNTTIGTNDGSGTERFLGDIAEIITYDRVLTADERSSVHDYLTSRYAIGAPSGESAASLTAVSTLTVAGTREKVAAATLAATSTLTTTAIRTQTAATALSATATLTTTAVRVQPAGAALSAAATLTATGVITEFAAAPLTAVSSLTVTSTVTRIAAAALSASSTLAVGAIVEELASVSLSAVSTLTAAGAIVQLGTAALSASSVLTVTAVRQQVAVVAMTAASALAVQAERAAAGIAALVASGTLTVAGTRQH